MREFFVNPEGERLSKFPILITGAGSGTGLEVTKKFVREGYSVIFETRSEDKFSDFYNSIESNKKEIVRPFIADLSDPESIFPAYDKLNLGCESLHFFHFAAGGFEKLLRSYARQLIPLQNAFRSHNLTNEMLVKATEEIKSIAENQNSMVLANQVNNIGPNNLMSFLTSRHHIGWGSRVTVLSSIISDYTDPQGQENYLGPWFYYPIGLTKAQGVSQMMRLVLESGAEFVDFVAPIIKDTKMAGILKNILSMLQGFDTAIAVPEVDMNKVVNVIYNTLTNSGSSKMFKKVYIKSSGEITLQRPKDWKIPVIPYL